MYLRQKYASSKLFVKPTTLHPLACFVFAGVRHKTSVASEAANPAAAKRQFVDCRLTFHVPMLDRRRCAEAKRFICVRCTAGTLGVASKAAMTAPASPPPLFPTGKCRFLTRLLSRTQNETQANSIQYIQINSNRDTDSFPLFPSPPSAPSLSLQRPPASHSISEIWVHAHATVTTPRCGCTSGCSSSAPSCSGA